MNSIYIYKSNCCLNVNSRCTLVKYNDCIANYNEDDNDNNTTAFDNADYTDGKYDN